MGAKLPSEKPATGADLFIVDNSDNDWKVINYLKEWTDLATAFDIAARPNKCTGHF
jgi:hypothetical protein